MEKLLGTNLRFKSHLLLHRSGISLAFPLSERLEGKICNFFAPRPSIPQLLRIIRKRISHVRHDTTGNFASSVLPWSCIFLVTMGMVTRMMSVLCHFTTESGRRMMEARYHMRNPTRFSF